jgi:hypothetical protein
MDDQQAMATQRRERLWSWMIHVAAALPLAACAALLSFFFPLWLKDDPLMKGPVLWLLPTLLVLASGALISSICLGVAIVHGGRRPQRLVYRSLLWFPLGLLLTATLYELLIGSPAQEIVYATQASIFEKGFVFTRNLMRTLPYGGFHRVLMAILLSPVFLILGVFDLLLAPFVPLIDPNYYVVLFYNSPYFVALGAGAIAPSWMLARRLSDREVSEQSAPRADEDAPS